MTARKATNPDYPQETPGSELAAEIRQQANALTDGEREELFKRGMQIIYGGSAKEARARQ